MAYSKAFSGKIFFFILILIFSATTHAESTQSNSNSVPTASSESRPKQGTSEWVDYLINDIGQRRCSEMVPFVGKVNLLLVKKKKVNPDEMKLFRDYVSFLRAGISLYDQDKKSGGKGQINPDHRADNEMQVLNEILTHCGEKRNQSRKIGDAMIYVVSKGARSSGYKYLYN